MKIINNSYRKKIRRSLTWWEVKASLLYKETSQVKKYNCSTRSSANWKRRLNSYTVNFTSQTWPRKNWSKLMRLIKIFSTRRKNTDNNAKQSRGKCRSRNQHHQKNCHLLVNLLWHNNLKKSSLCLKGNLTKCRNNANNFKIKELPYCIR